MKGVIHMKMYIGNNIKQRRQESQLTQAELAKKMDVSDKCIWSWENNRTEPTSGAVQKMAQIFGCTTDELCSQINIDVSYEEYALLERYRSAPTTGKHEIEKFVKYTTEGRQL